MNLTRASSNKEAVVREKTTTAATRRGAIQQTRRIPNSEFRLEPRCAASASLASVRLRPLVTVELACPVRRTLTDNGASAFHPRPVPVHSLILNMDTFSTVGGNIHKK